MIISILLSITNAQAENLPFQSNTNAPIINGVDASTDEYPMAGGILMDGMISMNGWGDQPLHSFICSSTLIAPDVVLTAAHCVDEGTLTFGMGSVENLDMRWTTQSDLSSWDGSDMNVPWPDDAVSAWDWVAHPGYDMNDFDVGLAENDDLALIFLDTPIFDFPHAYLPTEGLGSQLTEGDEVIIVGWGQQSATSQWEAPPAGSFAIKQQAISDISELGSSEFQVGQNESDARKCHGDSGGPSFLMMDGSLRVVGVTSHAYDSSDCFETGGVDTRVDAYIEWIDNEMRIRCEDGSRAWCDVEGIVEPDFYDQPNNNNTEEEENNKLFGCNAVMSPLGWSPYLFGLLLVAYRRQ
jgi:hypothetical protein